MHPLSLVIAFICPYCADIDSGIAWCGMMWFHSMVHECVGILRVLLYNEYCYRRIIGRIGW